MRITLESTSKIVQLNGQSVRIWQGQTESGIPMHAYVPLVAVDKDADQTEFERELRSHAPPRAELEAIPMRMLV
jgi:hypothetical protein